MRCSIVRRDGKAVEGELMTLLIIQVSCYSSRRKGRPMSGFLTQWTSYATDILHSVVGGVERRYGIKRKEKKEPGLSATIDDDKLFGGVRVIAYGQCEAVTLCCIALAKMGRKCDQGLGAAHGHCASHRYPFFPFIHIFIFPQENAFVPFSFFIYISYFFLFFSHTPVSKKAVDIRAPRLPMSHFLLG